MPAPCYPPLCLLGFGLELSFFACWLSGPQRPGDLVLKASYRGRSSRVDAIRAKVGHHDRRERREAPDKSPRDAGEIGNQCITMGDPEAAPMDARDVPKFAKFGHSRLKHADRRRIVIQVVGFTSDQRNGDVCLGHYARIDATITDVRDLETTAAAVLKKANPIIRRQAADMKVSAQRRRQ